MTLEHYRDDEKALEKIVAEARARWEVMDVLVVHRVGELKPTDQIVLSWAAPHRGEPSPPAIRHGLSEDPRAVLEEGADAPGARWVEARATDDEAAQRWSAQVECRLSTKPRASDATREQTPNGQAYRSIM